MNEKIDKVSIFTLLTINIVLMASILGLFFKVNQLQQQLLDIFKPALASNEPEGLSSGTIAPIFSLQGIDGQYVSNEKYSGKKYLLIFYSPQCPKCREVLPAIKELSHTEKSPDILMISNAEINSNRQMASDEKLNFPVLLWNETIAEQYKVPGTPFFYLIDTSGKVATYGSANTLDELEALIGL